MPIKHFLLIYELSSDYVEKRPLYRQSHLELAWASHARDGLLLGGAFSAPYDTAALLFRASDEVVAHNFARNDPYVTNGIVTSRRVREWITVVGDDASNPVRVCA